MNYLASQLRSILRGKKFEKICIPWEKNWFFHFLMRLFETRSSNRFWILNSFKYCSTKSVIFRFNYALQKQVWILIINMNLVSCASPPRFIVFYPSLPTLTAFGPSLTLRTRCSMFLLNPFNNKATDRYKNYPLRSYDAI